MHLRTLKIQIHSRFRDCKWVNWVKLGTPGIIYANLKQTQALRLFDSKQRPHHRNIMFLQVDFQVGLWTILQGINMILFIVVIFSVICNVFSSSSVTNVRDTSHELAVLKRDKRWLVWKEGINWVAVIFS